MPREIALQVSYTMEQSMFQGTGTVARLADGRPSAGKTGTTQGSAQTWYIGYTPQLSTAAWVGSSRGNQQNFNITLNGRFIRTLFGSTVAAPMWRDFMNRALAGTEIVDLLQPFNYWQFLGFDENYDDEYDYGYGYGDGHHYNPAPPPPPVYVPTPPPPPPAPEPPAPVEPTPPPGGDNGGEHNGGEHNGGGDGYHPPTYPGT